MKRVFYVCSIFFLYILSVFNCSPNSVLAGERTDKLIWGAGKSSSYEMGTLSPADEKIVNNSRSKVDLNKNPQAFFIINGGTVGNHDGGVNNFPLTLTTKYSYNVKAKPGEKLTFTVNGIRGIEPEVERAITINGKLVNGKDVGTILTEHTTSVWFVVVTYDSKGKEISSQKTKEITTGKISNGTMTWTMPKNTNLVKISACYNAKSKKKYNSGGLPISETIIASYSITPTNFTSAANQTNTAKQKTGGNPQNSKDSDISTITIAVGTVAAGVLGWGAMQFFGRGGTAGASSTIPGGGSIPDNPYYKKDGEDLIYTDPATGAQSIYSQDSEGNWVNVETGGVLDVSRADEAVNERLATKKWVENQRTKESETTKTLRELDRKLAEENEKITRETARDKIAVKTGSYGLTPEEKRVRFEEIKSKEQEKIAHYTSRGNTFAAGENIAKVVEYTADVAMDGLGAVGGPAKAITEGYKVVKSAAKGASESLVNAQGSGKTIKEKLGDMAGAAFKGGVNGVIDAVEYHVGGAGLKTQMAVNVVGDMLKGGLDAAYKGESIVKAAAKGAVSGTLKVGVNQAGAALGKKVAAKDLSVFRDKYNTIKNSWSKDLSEKTIDHHIKMTATKHVMTKSAHTVEMGMGKSVIKRGIGTMLK